MKFISENKISEELINSFVEVITLEFSKRLKGNNYNDSFGYLKDWHIRSPLVINKPELRTKLYLSSRSGTF